MPDTARVTIESGDYRIKKRALALLLGPYNRMNRVWFYLFLNKLSGGL